MAMSVKCDKCGKVQEYTTLSIYKLITKLLIEGLQVDGWKVVYDEILCKECYDSIG